MGTRPAVNSLFMETTLLVCLFKKIIFRFQKKFDVLWGIIANINRWKLRTKFILTSIFVYGFVYLILIIPVLTHGIKPGLEVGSFERGYLTPWVSDCEARL